MTMSPESILPDLLWSFMQPVPASVPEFVKAAEAYASETGYALNSAELERRFPVDRVDVEYAYHVREAESGPWDERRKIVRVNADGHPLTYGKIIRDLHAAAYADLSDQDHHFFEGLFLLETEFEPGVPAYEVFLGS
jgi:hypothetical protein